MKNLKHPPGPPMTLGNMREQGVRGLAVYCLNHECRHHKVISADDYADEIQVPSFALRLKCSKCGGRRIDVRPNWKEAPGSIDDWSGRPAMPSSEG
jgi:hypothetical protein